MSKVRMSACLGAMKLLAGFSGQDLRAVLGVSPEELKVVTGDIPWKAQQVSMVRRVIEAFAHGTMDVAGLNRFEVTAEYMAAVVVAFIHPINMMQACRIVEKRAGASDLSSGGVVTEEIMPKQLFALVTMLMDEGAAAELRSQFEATTKKALEKASLKGGDV